MGKTNLFHEIGKALNPQILGRCDLKGIKKCQCLASAKHMVYFQVFESKQIVILKDTMKG